MIAPAPTFDRLPAGDAEQRPGTAPADRPGRIRGVCAAALAALVAVALTSPAQAQKADPKTLDYRLQARSLAPGVWVVEGDNADFTPANGCNIINTGFIATGAGVVVINSGPSKRYGEQLRALIARTTAEPVVQVLHLNLHPDYFLGNQAFADVPRRATANTRAGIARESAAYETNLYRLCGDWMKGTETLAPDVTIDPAANGGRWRLGEREFDWHDWRGHTASDLVLVDRTSGIAFAGGLVFADRVPTTPHARLADWLRSLQQFGTLEAGTVVPSHGPVHADGRGAAQTQRYLQWLDRQFSDWAAQGLDMNDVLRGTVPDEFRRLAAFDTEYRRNVAHLYPLYENKALGAAVRSAR